MLLQVARLWWGMLASPVFSGWDIIIRRAGRDRSIVPHRRVRRDVLTLRGSDVLKRRAGTDIITRRAGNNVSHRGARPRSEGE